MAREVTFLIPMDIPGSNRRARWAMKLHLATVPGQVLGASTNDEPFGAHGEPVGLSFVWTTGKGYYSGLRSIAKLMFTLTRAFIVSGLVGRVADVYPMTCRLKYTRDADPSCTVVLREGDPK